MRAYAAARAHAGVCAGVIGVVAALAAPTLHARQATDLEEVLYNMANSLGMLPHPPRGRPDDDRRVLGQRNDGRGRPADGGTSRPTRELLRPDCLRLSGMRVDITRASGTPEREIQVVSGTFAWNEIDEIGGGLVPGYGSAVPAMDTVSDRLLQLWTTPAGVVKGATAAGDQTKVTVEKRRCRRDFSARQR